MDNEIDNEAAIEFSRGFYDALGAGHDIDRAFEEGITAVRLAGFDADCIRMLK
jgi:hypothetical protein